jgi:hypothetical protein
MIREIVAHRIEALRELLNLKQFPASDFVCALCPVMHMLPIKSRFLSLYLTKVRGFCLS